MEGEHGEHEAGEDLVRRGDDVGSYGFADECNIRDDKLAEGCRSVAAGMTPAIPTNNKPARREAGAKAGAEAVATGPETERITTARAAEDSPRDAPGSRLAKSPRRLLRRSSALRLPPRVASPVNLSRVVAGVA